MPTAPPEFQRYVEFPSRGLLPSKPPNNLLQELFKICWYTFVFAGSVFFLVAFFYANSPKIGGWIKFLFNWMVNLLRI